MTLSRPSFKSSAYTQTIRETEDPRRIERRVFAQVTRDLEVHGQGAASDTELLSRNEALARNQMLWGHLMFDVMDTANSLPDTLKARIISFALFVDRHTGDVLRGDKSVDALIQLNRCMMHGLESRRPDAPAEEALHGA